LVEDLGNIRFSFCLLSHDFYPALASILEEPLFTAWSLLDDVESFLVGDVIFFLDFIDDLVLELFREVFENLGYQFYVGVG
jgi:hypothetical protein